jgi:hypothetical protein
MEALMTTLEPESLTADEALASLILNDAVKELALGTQSKDKEKAISCCTRVSFKEDGVDNRS